MNGIDTDKAHPFVEDCIARKEPFIKVTQILVMGSCAYVLKKRFFIDISLFMQVLRLVCMQALTNNGLKPKVLEYYKREILQTYGFQHALTLCNLEQAGLIRVQVSTNNIKIC